SLIPLFLQVPAIARFGFVQRKVVPSIQIRCSTTPSLRAKATRARFRPRHFATSSAQRFKLESRVVRVSITLAASFSAVRTDSSPVRVMPPLTSLSPDWYFFGTNPNSAPIVFDLAIRPGSSIADLNVMATSGPTPGLLISRRQISSSRTIRSISRCNCSNLRQSAALASNIALVTRSEYMVALQDAEADEPPSHQLH